MINNIQIEISELKDNRGEVLVKNEEWINYYNQFYQMNFAQISAEIKMHGFRKGNIPSILLEIKYPYLVEETNQKSILAVIQMVYLELLKIHKDAKFDNYRIDEKTKNFILHFSIKEGNTAKETSETAKETSETAKEELSTTSTTKKKNGKKNQDKKVEVSELSSKNKDEVEVKTKKSKTVKPSKAPKNPQNI